MKKTTNYKKTQRNIYYFLLAPCTILFGIYVILPIFLSFLYSFTSYDGFHDAVFIGLENYITLFQDPKFYKYMFNTLVYVGVSVVFIYATSLFIAVQLTKPNLKFRSTFRTILYIPSIIAVVIVAVMWKWLLGDTFGIVNQVLVAMGLDPIKTLSDPTFARWTVVLVNVWMRVGFFMIIFIGALNAVPRTLYEAASIDGATKTQQFWKITMPSIKATTFLVIMLATIECFKAFPLIVNLTSGGPGDSTTLIVQYMYQTGFTAGNFGYASAMSMIMLLVIGVLTFVNFKLGGDQ